MYNIIPLKDVAHSHHRCTSSSHRAYLCAYKHVLKQVKDTGSETLLGERNYFDVSKCTFTMFSISYIFARVSYISAAPVIPVFLRPNVHARPVISFRTISLFFPGNVFYMMEYRDVFVILLKKFDETRSSRYVPESYKAKSDENELPVNGTKKSSFFSFNSGSIVILSYIKETAVAVSFLLSLEDTHRLLPLLLLLLLADNFLVLL